MILALLLGHAIADSPLQNTGMSRRKRDADAFTRWQAMLQHGLIHAALVCFVTGSALLGFAELILHCAIDRAKGRGWINTWVDQGLHVACKIAWAYLA